MSMPDSFTVEAVKAALKKMFRPDGHFSICTVDTCLRAAGVTPPKQQYDALSALHCVSFKDMEPELREQVYARTLALFADGTMFDLSAIDRGFTLINDRRIGALVSEQETPERKRKVIGLPWGSK